MSVETLQSRYLLESYIEKQEAERSAAAERKLEGTYDEAAVREFSEAMADAARATETARVFGHGAITAAHGATAPQEAQRVAPPEEQGDAILGGIQMLRATFDERIANIVQPTHVGSLTDTHTLFQTQANLAVFTVLIDTTSKIGGKMVQTGDTLLKS